MKELDEIIYDAVHIGEHEENPSPTKQAIAALVGERIFSTCIPVPPTEEDNTPVPYLIITDDPFNNEQGTKDDVWESDTDRVQSSVEIAGHSPKEVKHLRKLVRRALREHVAALPYSDIPQLVSVSNDGIAWDWIKPCYYDRLHYQCDVTIQDDEQEEPSES